MRVEQLAPFPEEVLAEELSRYPKTVRIVWCQEEPRNMGAWRFIAPRLEAVLGELDMRDARAPMPAGRRPPRRPPGFTSSTCASRRC